MKSHPRATRGGLLAFVGEAFWCHAGLLLMRVFSSGVVSLRFDTCPREGHN